MHVGLDRNERRKFYALTYRLTKPVPTLPVDDFGIMLCDHRLVYNKVGQRQRQLFPGSSLQQRHGDLWRLYLEHGPRKILWILDLGPTNGRHGVMIP